MIRTLRIYALVAVIGVVGIPVDAKYVPPKFFELAGASDLIVTGKIIELRENTFLLLIEKIVAGEYLGKTIEITKFQDWPCASRWKPYAINQREIAFLWRVPDKNKDEYPAPLALLSAGAEGEWEIIGKSVYSLGFRVPGFDASEETEHPGQELNIDVLMDAIKGFRKCFSVIYKTDSEDPWNPMIGVKCSGEEILAYKDKSVVHQYLAETALEFKRTHK